MSVDLEMSEMSEHALMSVDLEMSEISEHALGLLSVDLDNVRSIGTCISVHRTNEMHLLLY